MRKINVWTGLALFGLAALGAAPPLAGAQRGARHRSKAPAFTARDLGGKPVSLATYKGKILLIDFWATWCPPCRAEMPNLVRTYKRYRPRGFEILGVSLDTDKKALASFLKKHGASWRQIFEEETDYALMQAFGIESVPTMLLVDGASGRILAVNPRGGQLGKAVAAALKARGR